jgi:hypothetical protein
MTVNQLPFRNCGAWIVFTSGSMAVAIGKAW